MWVRAEGAFEAIVEPSDFYTVQGILRERSRRYSDDEMLEKLKILRQQNGWLSGIVIDEQEDMPSSSAYQHRFGSLIRAYQLIGYTPERDYRYIEINRRLRALHSEIVEDTIRKIENLNASMHREIESDLLCLNGELKISVIICRCYQTKSGAYRWKIRLDSGLEPDVTVVVRMSESYTQSVLDLLKRGEERLLSAVESGHIPMAVAISIAYSPGNRMKMLRLSLSWVISGI